MIRRFGTLIGFFIIVIYFASQRPDTFMSLRNWLNIAEQVSILGVVAFTSTVVMVVGDFDLSVGSMASLSGIIAASLVDAEMSLMVGVAAALGAGLLGGLFNGVLVSYARISPFVAT
ncbi:MAG: ABC transporter permease, partial [Chloroflexota bacterium]